MISLPGGSAGRDRHVFGEEHSHRARGQLAEFLDARQQHQLAFPDQRDPVAHAIHFGKHVRRHEHRSAALFHVHQEFVEGLLHQRIEPLGRLVQDQEQRVGLKRLNQSELALHAGAVFAQAAAQVAVGEFQALLQLAAARFVDHAAR